MDIKIKIGVVIINDNGTEVLFIKEKTKKNNKPLWNIIKGSYGDNGNENIFETATRECLEEASVKVQLLNSLGVYISKKGKTSRIQFNFIGKIIEGIPKIADAKEQESRNEYIQEIRWFNLKEISKLKREDFISNRIFELVQDWLSGKKYPLEIYRQVSL